MYDHDVCFTPYALCLVGVEKEDDVWASTSRHNQISEAVVGMISMALCYTVTVMLTNSKQWTILHLKQFKIAINGVKMSILTFASSLRRLWSTACLLCVERALCAIQYMMETCTPVARLRAGRERDPPSPPSLLFI